MSTEYDIVQPVTADAVLFQARILKVQGMPITGENIVQALGCEPETVLAALDSLVEDGKLKARAEAVEPSLGGGVAKDVP